MIAAPIAKLAASFAPDRLGAPTTVTFVLNVDPPAEAAPPPLSQIDFSYPGNLGFVTSGLGLAACDPGKLQAEGGQVCPANSRMGGGSATVEVGFGVESVAEHVVLELFAAPSADGYVHLAILARGKEPVEARIVITGVLLAGHLQISVPVIPGLPGGPDVAITQIRASLGGALRYYEQVRGRLVAYRPKGIGLPDTCPRGGWRLGARLAFQNGQHSQAGAVVSCPRRRSRRRGSLSALAPG
ncbi:MAG: hypothetical protein M3Z95_00160 [Actinomycetota bacterium]|nr:hypothetical protein [Actinomycetota bacterium]